VLKIKYFAAEAHGGHRGKFPLILDLGRWVVSFTLWSLYPWRKQALISLG